MPIKCAPITLQGTRTSPLSKQLVPMSHRDANTPHHGQGSKSGSV